MKSLTPVAILDNATSKRFLHNEEIRASLPPEGQKVAWHLSNMTIGEGCLVEGAWHNYDEDGLYVKDDLHHDLLPLYEFSHWYREEDLNAEMLAFIIEVNAAYKIEWLNKKATDLIRRAGGITASEQDLLTHQFLS